MPATIQYHTTFTFTSVVRVSLQRSNVCSRPSNYIAGINISSYDAVGNYLRNQMFGISVWF